jgi:hypothetical protein
MKKPKSVLLGVACFGLLVFGISFLTSIPAPAAPPPPSTAVTVTNTPLPVQGTVNANITNATVPVAGTVNVASLPAVTLNSGATVGINSGASAPVYVEPDAFAAINAFNNRMAGGASLNNVQFSENNCTNILAVPNGYRLVLESVSLTAQVPAGTVVPYAYFGVDMGPVTGVLPVTYMVPVKSTSTASSDYYVATSTARGYFSAGALLGVGLTANATNGLTPFRLECNFSGHLVPES